MLKKLSTIALSAALVATGANALAAKPGLYVGGGIGYSDIDMGSLDYYTGFNGFSAGLYAGYNFELNQRYQLGVEINSKYLGNFENLDDHMYSVSLLATGRVQLDPVWDAFAKFGIVREFMGGGDRYELGSSDIAPEMAIGLAYNINANWGINLEYSHIFGRSFSSAVLNESNSAFTFDSIMLNVTYHFGQFE